MAWGLGDHWLGELTNLASKPPKPPKAKDEKIDRPGTREIGAPGTINSQGYLMLAEEVNADWRNTRTRIAKIEEMRRTDGQVYASVLCCRLPILASTWMVRPPEDPTPKEQEIADFVDLNLHGMTQPWTEVLSQILTYLEFGFAVFEKVYKVGPDGKWHWKKWSPRHQSTIIKWNTANDGGLDSVTQWAYKDNRAVEIPMAIDRLIVFTNAKEGANWEGQSILRAAYKHYYIKDRMYRIDAIAQERHGVGVPIIKMPDGAGDADYDIAERILIDLRSHEKGYIIEPAGFETRILDIGNQSRNPMETIKHHDEKIATSVLAQFLNLGFSSTGSRALGQSFSDFFLASLNTYTAYISGIINRHAVKQLVDVNFGEQERYPSLRAVPVAGIDFERFARSMLMLGQNQLIAPDQKLIEHIATIFGLPRPDPKAVKEMMDMKKQAAMAKSQPPAGSGGNNKAGSSPKPTEKKTVSESVAGVIELQKKALIASAKDNGNRFRSRLEGTLLNALLLESDQTNRDAVGIAAKEFSRRLAVAAELGFSVGGQDAIAQYVDEEIERSESLLTGVLKEPVLLIELGG